MIWFWRGFRLIRVGVCPARLLWLSPDCRRARSGLASRRSNFRSDRQEAHPSLRNWRRRSSCALDAVASPVRHAGADPDEKKANSSRCQALVQSRRPASLPLRPEREDGTRLGDAPARGPKAGQWRLIGPFANDIAGKSRLSTTFVELLKRRIKAQRGCVFRLFSLNVDDFRLI